MCGNLSKIVSTLLIVIIGVHFVMTLDDVTDKTPDNKEQINQRVLEPFFRKTYRFLAGLPDVPSESISRKAVKSIKYKKRRNSEENDSEDEEDEEDSSQEDEENQEEDCEGGSKNSNPYFKTIIKYVPIPIYLKPSKPKPYPIRSYGLMDSLTIKDNLMPMRNSVSGDYGMMGMHIPIGGGYGSRLNFGPSYNLMDMNGGNLESYGLPDMMSGYPSMRSRGSALHSKQNKKYVLANYANHEYKPKGAGGCAPDSNGNDCESNNGNKEMENQSNYGTKEEMIQYENDQANTGSDPGYNKNGNHHVNKKRLVIQIRPNSMNSRRHKMGLTMTTTTTTEQPIDNEIKEEEEETQYGDNGSRTKMV